MTHVGKEKFQFRWLAKGEDVGRTEAWMGRDQVLSLRSYTYFEVPSSGSILWGHML